MTVVSSAGVTVEKIHRWPDKIGEKISLHAGKPKVTALHPGMNRQQRRAMQRDQAKRQAY